MKYVIAYDIADPKRLARVARRLERHAHRVQKSVFLADLSYAQLVAVLDELQPLLQLRDDCVQAWKLAEVQPAGLARGAVFDVTPGSVVVHKGGPQLIGGESRD